MLLSMTGYGDARRQNERLDLAVEVRAVNNRYLKILTKCPESYAPLESRIERRVRDAVTRGTVTVSVRARRLDESAQYRLDQAVLRHYWKQINRLASELHVAMPNDLGDLLLLPGVACEEEPDRSACEADWPLIEEALSEALGKLHSFRQSEGESMQKDLQVQADGVARQLNTVAEQAPQVVSDYRDRLKARIEELLGDGELNADDPTLMREVSFFAEKCDVNEEVTRLRSHLEQFASFLEQQQSPGRKLEFLAQEMFREVNTIGSKANNVGIAHAVVEMKSCVEKMREILQNVE